MVGPVVTLVFVLTTRTSDPVILFVHSLSEYVLSSPTYEDPDHCPEPCVKKAKEGSQSPNQVPSRIVASPEAADQLPLADPLPTSAEQAEMISAAIPKSAGIIVN